MKGLREEDLTDKETEARTEVVTAKRSCKPSPALHVTQVHRTRPGKEVGRGHIHSMKLGT